MPVDYNHGESWHSLTGPQAVVPVLFRESMPRSLLDVGCGIGTWMKAARQHGIDDVFGVDGAELSAAALHVPIDLFRVVDLTQPWNLNRTFDVALCLEVAEHLDPHVAPLLVETLTRHADRIVFSAACPGQPGQHHVNCQWPDYWQQLFNASGFVCSDAIRWQIWNHAGVEVWYRQNMFVAVRDAAAAGNEERLTPVIHPEFLQDFVFAGVASAVAAHMKNVEQGTLPLGWYGTSVMKALAAKLRRRWHSAQ